MAVLAMISYPSGVDMRRSRSPSAIKRFAGFGYRRDPPAPVNRLSAISRVETIRRDFRREEFSESLVNLLLAGNRSTTHSTYESAWRNWVHWCGGWNENPLLPSRGC